MSLGTFLALVAMVLVPVAAQTVPVDTALTPFRLVGLAFASVALVRIVVEIARWNRSDPSTREPEIRINARLAILALVAVYLVVEVGATAAVHLGGKADSLREFRARQTLTSTPQKVSHPLLIMVNNPDLPGVNSLGFWDREWPVEKPPGTIRIACLGGSTTEDGYPRRLGEELSRRLPDLDIEVMNFGNGSWTTAQTLVNYELNVRRYSPDWIVLHHAVNDRSRWGRGRVRHDLSDAYAVLAPEPRRDVFWVRYLDSYAAGKLLFHRATGRDEGLGAYGEIHLADGLEEGPATPTDVRIFIDNLGEIVHVAASHGTRTLMTTQPYSLTDLSWSDYWVENMRTANEAIRRLAAERGAPLVDLDSIMTGDNEQFHDPIHLHPDAVETKAGAIADALVELLSAG